MISKLEKERLEKMIEDCVDYANPDYEEGISHNQASKTYRDGLIAAYQMLTKDK